MKKFILAAAALLTIAAQPALAKGKKKACGCQHAAAANTDHSYDQAYSARWARDAKQPGAPVNTTATMQSDVRKSSYAGYTNASGPWYPNAQAANADQIATFQSDRTVNLQGITVRENSNDGYMRPSPYLGDVSPTNDGPQKNQHRNMNAANTAQPLAPSTGMSSNR